MIINCGYYYTNRKINAAQLHSLLKKKKRPLYEQENATFFFFCENVSLLLQLSLYKVHMSMRIWNL